MSEPAYLAYWGKTAGRQEPGWHRLAHHGLDVAAVGLACMGRQGFGPLLSTGNHDFDRRGLAAWIGFFLAIHDLGKFASSFQGLRPDLADLSGHGDVRMRYSHRHDALGDALWRWKPWRAKLACALANPCAPGRQPARDLDWDQLGDLTPAVFGHHGAPVSKDPKLVAAEHFTPDDQAAALCFVLDAFHLFGLAVLPWPELDEVKAKRLSWGLAGLAVLADWIGSDARRFPFVQEPMPLGLYFEKSARPRAEAALGASGALAPEASAWTGFSGLFPEIAAPSPLQALVGSMDLGQGPALHILEDVTGSGKTEAALALAHRVMNAGLARGVYVGLPTMATASAMYGRMRRGYRRLFAPYSTPCLVLAHASRNMDPEFRRSIGFEDMPARETLEPFEGQAACSAWLADNRKKALLAAMGVGTLDQALLATLPARHQCLRLLGLGRSVLVADEVHAYDVYTTRLLASLLRFQAALGGSAILLSATLPTRIKQSLAAAFAAGLDAPCPHLASRGYPLVTSLDQSGQARELRVGSRLDVSRFVRVLRLPSPRAALEALAEAALSGACALYVRNTVDDAVAAHRALSAVLPGRVDLFHARFVLGDRQAIEKRILDRFGPGSTPEARRGRVVVATQVAEQSLDVDFDLAVSDLAPMESLVQRAGRCCRHCGRERPEGYGEPRLLVVSPDPEGEVGADWYAAMFRGAAHVYPAHGRLWRTARRLFGPGGFDLSREGRDLMERVYGEDAEAPPPALEPSDLEHEGRGLAESALAWDKALNVDAGYGPDQTAWQDDDAAFTRLGEPSVTFRLHRYEAGKAAPWSQGEDPAMEGPLSEIAVRRSRLAQAAPPTEQAMARALAKAVENLPQDGRIQAALLTPDPGPDPNVWRFEGTDGAGRAVRVRYSKSRGLEWGAGDDLPNLSE